MLVASGEAMHTSLGSSSSMRPRHYACLLLWICVYGLALTCLPDSPQCFLMLLVCWPLRSCT